MRYAPLAKHLSGVSEASVTLTYEEIENLLGRKLPATAYGDSWRQWWANTETHSQALAWLRAGWRVSRPSLANKCVEFRRQSGEVRPEKGPPARTATTGAREGETREPIVVAVDDLAPSAIRMIEDAAEEAGSGVGEAVAELLNRASMARRRQLLDWFAENAPRSGKSSVSMIREDRDAR